MRGIGLALMGLGAALLVNLRRGGANDLYASDDGSTVPDVGAQVPISSGDAEPYPGFDYEGAAVSEPNTKIPDALESPELQLASLLYAIRSSEHLFPASMAGDAAYQIFYGGSRFSDMSDHPVITREKKGVPLPPAMCRAAGFSSGVCVSTAAGAYQITAPTWREFRAAGAWGPRLDDFSAASQDEAARRILSRIGALDALHRGDPLRAFEIASRRWASLPWSRAQQHPRSVEFVVARYNEAGAVLGMA